MLRVTCLIASSLLTANAFVLPFPRGSAAVSPSFVSSRLMDGANADLDIGDLVNEAAQVAVNHAGIVSSDLIMEEDEEDEQALMDAELMNHAIQMAQSP